MNIALNVDTRIQAVSVTEDTITAQLVDGRTISVPLVWSWRLSEATPEQRARFEIIGSGSGIRWPEIDEDISVEGMLHGLPRRRSRPVRGHSHTGSRMAFAAVADPAGPEHVVPCEHAVQLSVDGGASLVKH